MTKNSKTVKHFKECVPALDWVDALAKKGLHGVLSIENTGKDGKKVTWCVTWKETETSSPKTIVKK
jgi:hypothetical protein